MQRPGRFAGGGAGDGRPLPKERGRVSQHGPKPYTSLFSSPPFSTPRASPTLLPVLLLSSSVCVEKVAEDLGGNAVKMSTNDHLGHVHPRFQLSARRKLISRRSSCRPLALGTKGVEGPHARQAYESLLHDPRKDGPDPSPAGWTRAGGRRGAGCLEPKSSPGAFSWLVCGRRANEKDSGQHTYVGKGKERGASA